MFEMSDEQKLMGELAGKLIKQNVEEVSNAIIYDNMELTNPDVLLIFTACFHDFTFTFMKALNLVLNGADAEKMGNINEFIQLLEAKYEQSQEFSKALKEFGDE